MKSNQLEKLSKEKILVMDGGMGTLILEKNLKPEDYGGEVYDGCPEILNVTRPDAIQSIHEAYLNAGSDIIETNTFGGTGIVLAEYGLENRVDELNKAAVKIAKEAANKYSTPDRPRFVAGSMGPTTKSLSVTGGISYEELENDFFHQAKALLAAGVDLVILETQQDTSNVKAGLSGITRAREILGVNTPIILSITIETSGTMLAGQSIDALYASVSHFDLFSIGLNCATGPEFMVDHVRTLSELTGTCVNVCPNAGMPDHNGEYELSPEGFSKALELFVEKKWVNVVGGCCGTTPEYIREVKNMVAKYQPRVPEPNRRFFLSGIEPLEITEDNRPIIVGERTNSIGSRKFKRLIAEGKYEEASEIARTQVKSGAYIVDVCLANPDRDELADLKEFMKHVTKKVKVPFMIDSTDSTVLEEGLKWSQGRCVINSINLEEGEERFKKVVPLAKRYGAALVVGTIDDDPEQGMGLTRERKLSIAKRSYDLLINKYGLMPEDIIFDPLVFPVGTGDEQYNGSAEETIEALKMIKKELPGVSTILGVSNVSFGLPPAGREVLNAVYLYHTTKAGLDFAIVNSEKLERYAAISEHERKLAEDLLFFRGDDPIIKFADFYKDKKVEKKSVISSLSLEERLSGYIIEGTKQGLTEDLDKALKEKKPIEIINGPLMNGMGEVGRLFNDNQLIVAEVLQSAEAMRSAVDYLRNFMEHSEMLTKGKILLATVKGDVHDIGKNLVEIILSNNGYTVVNLGIKVPPEKLIEAQRKESADAIALSGLLVKSTQQMVITAGDLKNAGIDVPLLVGGAALTRRFTDTKIKPAYTGPVLYAKEAMEGLTIADAVINPKTREAFIASRDQEGLELKVKQEARESGASVKSKISHTTSIAETIPAIPFDETKLAEDYDLKGIFSLINPRMLFGKHLGLKGDPDKLLAKGDAKAKELTSFIASFQQEIIETNMIKPKSICRFYRAVSEGDSIILFDPKDPDKEVGDFSFPRQKTGDGLCLSDYVLSKSDGRRDNIALFVTTGGEGIPKMATRYKEEGEYLKSHSLSAIAIETAEALAELLHKQIRESWGIKDPEGLAPKDLFTTKYQGRRYSFGYPACPDLSDQKKLFDLLKPEQIGVNLTDGFMMEPEASVSAMVFHHPEAKYFSVG